MLNLIQELQTRATAALVVPGTVGRVYLGIAGQERQALISDYDLLVLDIDGEDPRPEGVSSTECILKHVVFNLLVRTLDTEETITTLLTKWDAVQNFIYDTANRRIEVGGQIVGESIDEFFGIVDSFTGGGDMPLWRTRSTIVDYRVAATRLGRHPY